MTSYVDKQRHSMFHESAKEVKKHLTYTCRQVEELMSNKTDEVYVLMRKDYMTAITGAHPHSREVPKWRRIIKAKVTKILEELEEAAAKNDLAAKIISDLEEEQAMEHDNKVRKDDTAQKPSLEESVLFESLSDAEKMIQDTLNEEYS
jgi:hypothetical protein